MLDTRLIIVEGVMGSGKTTLSKAIARCLHHQGYPTKHIPESFREHPTSVTKTLTHWQKIWIEHTVALLHDIIRCATRDRCSVSCGA